MLEIAITKPTLDRAVEVFARGFAFTRCFTHPYLVERFGPLWLLRDAPRSSGDLRTEEWITHFLPPAQVHEVVRKQAKGRLAISYIHPHGESDEPLRAAFKSLSYRLRTTEPMMIHPLQKIPAFNCPATIERVTTQSAADELAKIARKRQILPEHLTGKNPPLRQYIARINHKIVGWVRSIPALDSAWCSNMHVLPQFRRRGIARALLSQMLTDDRTHGAKDAILLASHTGAKLYPVVGYQPIATLYLYTPSKSA